jgi:hypothetical protein
VVTFIRRHRQLFDPDPKLISTNRVVTFVITSSNVLYHDDDGTVGQ